MERFDFNLIDDGDSLLILGSAGEDYIIAYSICKFWDNVTLYRYESGEKIECPDERNDQLEVRVSGPFSQKIRRKGTISITLKSYGSSLNVTSSDIDKFDWIIKVCSLEVLDPQVSGFAPFILHKKIRELEPKKVIIDIQDCLWIGKGDEMKICVREEEYLTKLKGVQKIDTSVWITLKGPAVGKLGGLTPVTVYDNGIVEWKYGDKCTNILENVDFVPDLIPSEKFLTSG